MVPFEEGDVVKFYSRVHKKDVEGDVEFKGNMNCIVVHKGTRYSLQNNQITRATPF